ncbi:MAG: septum formation inhibitor Maf [Deltaproteobacteria bacterium]|nr:septum formation inhibitor Maf [Deltaproteobacteria bacterium]
MSVDRVTLVLASGSPRRRALLGQMGIPLQVEPPDVDEGDLPGERPMDFVTRVARKKGLAVLQAHPGRIVLAADTAVVLEGRLFGKPADFAHAKQMLRELAGRVHEVVTGVFVAGPLAERSLAVTTRVRFRALSEEEIGWYVATSEPMDKAGAYAIQERGGAFVESIEGSTSNVVGLPLAESLELLESVGLELPWRKVRP